MYGVRAVPPIFLSWIFVIDSMLRSSGKYNIAGGALVVHRNAETNADSYLLGNY